MRSSEIGSIARLGPRHFAPISGQPMQDSNLSGLLSLVLSAGTNVRESRACGVLSHITCYSLLLPAANKYAHTSGYAEIASGYLLFIKNVIGCNQPKQDPVAEVWRQTLPGQLKTLQGRPDKYVLWGESDHCTNRLFAAGEE